MKEKTIKINNELEQIAKQVNLLNRLIELFMMQEAVSKEIVEFFGWEWDEENFYQCWREPGNYSVSYVRTSNFLEAWNHPLTQRAWGDELVRVAREYNNLFFEGTNYETFTDQLQKYASPTIDYWQSLIMNASKLSIDVLAEKLLRQAGLKEDAVDAIYLEAILNKYGRSLNE